MSTTLAVSSDASLMPLSNLSHGEKPTTRRIYLIRNGESCDRLGPAWRHKVFRDHELYRVTDLNQPVKILDRSSPDLFRNDSPLTQVGSVSSQLLDRGMLLKSAGVHIVFSSPALRCIQTAAAVIENLNMKQTPKICVEPALIDPLLFYWQDRLPSYLSVEQFVASGFSIQTEYQPTTSISKLNENLFHEKTPDDFFQRLLRISKRIIESSEERVSGGVMVVSHAPVIDGLYRIITDSSERPRSTSDLHRMGLSYPFSSVTTLEQDPQTMKWNLCVDAIPPLTNMHLSTAIQVSPFDFFDDKTEENVKPKRWKNDSSNVTRTSRSSSLYIHIAEYENYFEEDTVTLDKKDGLKRKEKSSNLIKEHKQVLQNPFEFPRQQQNHLTDPAVMQFKASQQLLKPNQSGPSNKSQQKIQKVPAPPAVETHLAVAAPGNPNEVKIGTPKYMLLSGFAGGIVSGGSHFLVTPIDVVHVRIQSHSPRFSKFFAAFRTTLSEEGFKGLARGWAPNLIGYSLQGFAKFGLYETLKKEYSAAVGTEFAAKHKTAIYLLAGASAETVGTLLLAPFESVKIRVQTCAEIPPQFRRALPYIYKAEGINGLFKGLVPLLLRQIPYTASKFVCFEQSREFIYKKVLKVDPVALNPSEKMAVTVTAGIIAGMCCEVISHPADVIVTQLYESPTTTFKSVVKSMDFKGLWVGTGARMVLIGVITGIQLFLIDSVRSSFNLEKGKPLERKICQY